MGAGGEGGYSSWEWGIGFVAKSPLRTFSFSFPSRVPPNDELDPIIRNDDA